jgi:hypothetical protein
MTPADTTTRLQELLDKDAIRHLVLMYSRGVDRKDTNLLRSLYTADGVDNHGPVYRGSASGYVDFLEVSFPIITVGAHYVCNHLISIEGDTAEGEVYAIGYHILPASDGGFTESFVGVRYLDHYRREAGVWKFALRDVVFDLDSTRTLDHRRPPDVDAGACPSYSVLQSGIFQRRTL